MIRNCEWKQLCKQPTATVIPLVREFYENAFEMEDEKSWVRGKYDYVTLNGLFGLEPIDDSTFQDLMLDPNTTWF